MSVKINNNLILQTTGDQIIIFDSEKSYLYTLNSTASFILKKLKKGLSKEEIAIKISKKYKIDLKTASEDITVCIEELHHKHILDSNTETHKGTPLV